ncbi:hypothetical protein U9J35_04220 [Rossellomorea aquimaris]|nr:hypothetical protein [Rossellomorea aquimaris]WRP07381.1 hypothetical protein U9J35_04220 [Rossellomorea aquimaris]
MKKLLLILAFGLILFISANGASAAENQTNGFLTDEEKEEINAELQVLKEEINKKLANGETDIEVQSENMKLGLIEKNVMAPSKLKGAPLNTIGSFAAASSVGSKEYQAYIAHTKGANFSHAVFGTFSWKGDYLTAVNADADLTGLFFSRSSKETVVGRDGRIGKDAKVGRVTSKGTFTPVKYWPTSSYTTIIVDVYAPTKSYRVIDAYIQ